MKITITVLILFAFNLCLGQSLSSFTLTQQSQLKAYVAAEIKKVNDPLLAANRLNDQRNKRDSINYVTDNAKLQSLIISTPKSLADSMAASRKALKDSMATLLPVSAVTVTLDSLMKAYKADFDKQIKELQDAGKLTDAEVLIIKQWMRNNFKF